jgi:hypothetical protein
MEPTNIFFITTTVFVGVLIILFLIIAFYVWRILRIGNDVAGTIKELSRSVKEESDQVLGVARSFREKAAKRSISHGLTTGIILMAAKRFFGGKKKGKK